MSKDFNRFSRFICNFLQFLSKLTLLFEKSRQKSNGGLVRLTFKRYDGRTKSKPTESSERKLLVRATFRNSKISAVIEAENVIKFQKAYCSLLRSNMGGLKKEKKKKKTAKSAQT